MRRYLTLILILISHYTYSSNPKREMRGTWIATVANIDWTMTQGTDSVKQKKDLIKLLDDVVENNMNCVVFQVRPTADALYNSSYEPWSHWVTGVQGKTPGYDPLQFVINECDKRGIAVHVWINPYRVWLDKVNIAKATDQIHPYNKHRDLVVSYGKSLYLQPAKQETRNYVCNIVAEIVRNYDIDALHIDDYFYPYKVLGEEFPDQDEFILNSRGFIKKDDWRRNNVDLIVKQISDTVKSIKPWVEFGISPFGVWRNKSIDSLGSDTRAGLSNYDDLYADIIKWQKLGWIDYVAPQIYWNIGFKAADYKTVAKWWNDNSWGTPVYTGNSSYRINPKSTIPAWRSSEEIVRQINFNRELPNIRGSIMYSAKSIGSSEFKKVMTHSVFSSKSLIPINERIDSIAPQLPEGLVKEMVGQETKLSWNRSEKNRRYVVYRFKLHENPDISNPENILTITSENSITITASDQKYLYGITALSRTHHESQLVLF